MIRNFLTTALRIFKKNLLFSFINIIGLSIGLAASIMIYLWVYDELSYDRFHENAENIYRLERDMFFEGEQLQVPITSPPLAPQVMSDYPAVEAYTRVAYDDVVIEDEKREQNITRIYYADSAFFEIFSFRVLQGNPDECLIEPFTVTMSETAARKYFGPDPELGSTIDVSYNGEKKPFRLTAIYEDFPHNSHIQADIIASFSSLNNLKHPMMMSSWMASFHYSYILLKENTDPKQLEAQMQDMVDKYFGPEIRNMMKIDDIHKFLKIGLVPVTDIHLTGNRTWEMERPGTRSSVIIFSLVSILLLMIAGINFMNLSTARASRRALEVGMRKVSGATRSELIRQFLGESLFFGFLALLLAVLFIELSLPAFSSFTGKDFTLAYLVKGWNLPVILVVWIVTAFFSGLYPAFFLSSYKPVTVLKGKSKANGISRLRTSLVVGQFIISISLIICSVTVYRQLQYINNKDLGYQREGLLNVPVEDRGIFSSYNALRNDLISLPGVKDVCRSMIVPTDQNYTDSPHLLRNSTKTFFPVVNRIDEHYLPVLRISVVAGQNFIPEMVRDTSMYYIINEAAVKMFGFKSPADAVGKEIGILAGQNNETRDWGQIVGVCENFHFQPLTEKIKPMVMSSSLSGHNNITIRLKEGSDYSQDNSEIGDVFRRHFPGKIYNSYFISENFEHEHLTERRLQAILLIFTILSVFIAFLGLFGLSVFSLEQRTKEIGIRKILGAEVFRIIRMISAEFSRLILMASLVALPLSWFIIKRWLENFPYHRDIEIWIFIGAVVVAYLVALLTVFVQSYRAAHMNPAEVVKYE